MADRPWPLTAVANWFRTQNQRLYAKSKRLSRMGIREFVESAIRDSASKRIRILNIGAGGEVEEIVRHAAQDTAAEIVSIDIDPNRAPELVCDVCALPFAEASFDMVTCIEVLEHVSRPHEGIREIRRVLRDDGVLALTTRFIFPLHDRPADYFRFTSYGLKLLLQNFGSVAVREQHNWGQTIGVLIIRLLIEDRRWIRLFSWPIYLCGRITFSCLGWVSRRFQTDSATSGYLVLAKK